MQYHHHPDGLIYIRGGSEEYVDAVANFEKDYGSGAPELPEGMIECIYDNAPGGRHVYFDQRQSAHPLEGAVDSAAHEAVIAALPKLLAAQSRRLDAENVERAEAPKGGESLG